MRIKIDNTAAWLKAHENLIITGQTGTGKTWLACAFGHQAAMLDHNVLYPRQPRLLREVGLGGAGIYPESTEYPVADARWAGP